MFCMLTPNHYICYSHLVLNKMLHTPEIHVEEIEYSAISIMQTPLEPDSNVMINGVYAILVLATYTLL